MKKQNLLLTFLIAATFLLGGGGATAQSSIVYENNFNESTQYPSDWTKVTGSSTVIGSQGTGSPASNAFRIGHYSASTNVVALPQFSEQVNTLEFSFDYKSSSDNSYGSLEIGYITNTSDASTFTAITSFTASNTTSYKSTTINMSSADENAYIALRYIQTAPAYWFIDNVVIVKSSSCTTPTNLSAIPTSTTADVTWTAGGGEEEWLLYYSKSSTAPADDLYSGTGVVTNIYENSYTLEGLDPNTTYYVYVRAKCGENDYSDWTAAVSFKTSYIQAIPYSYDFEDADELNCWTMRDCSPGTAYYPPTGISDAAYQSSSHSFLFQRIGGYDTQYLISPELSASTNGIKIKLYHKQDVLGATIQIGYSTTTNATASFTWGDATENAVFKSFTSFEYICPPATKYIAIKYYTTTTTAIYIDDISFQAVNAFTTAGNWSAKDNWSFGTLPTASDAVIINAACTIPYAYTAQANNITIDGGSVTIQDGGQLVCNNNPNVTVQKSIDAWTTTLDGKPANWSFIASPIVSADGIAPSSVTGMITDETGAGEGDHKYDLYYLNMAAGKDHEWQNYRQNSFNLFNGKGYLYANDNGSDLAFSGTIQPSNTTVTKSDLYDGYNLVGNPFTCNATLNISYYTLNATGDAILSESVGGSTPIAPCTGVIIENSSVTFTPTTDAVLSPGKGNVEMVLAQNVTTRGESTAKTLDNAIISFNEGSQLGKFYFGSQDANLYIPMENEEYAVVSSSAQGEMPVNFKAHRDGQYTITVNPQEVEMGYLHLIDNVGGKDIDLLATPSYTFNAKADDYESRFRLVFSANMVNADLNDDFAFFSNGQLVIANEGESILQVIDVNGRIVMTESVNGTCSKAIYVKAGVYVLRLIQGTDVKTQKIIVK